MERADEIALKMILSLTETALRFLSEMPPINRDELDTTRLHLEMAATELRGLLLVALR